VFDRTDQNLNRTNGSGAVLGANMEAVGFTRPPGTLSEAHHIIPSHHNRGRAADVRDLLEGIDPPWNTNEASNGVFLPAPHHPDLVAPDHRAIHTEVYYETLYNRLRNKDQSEIREELRRIADDLSKNNFKYKEPWP